MVQKGKVIPSNLKPLKPLRSVSSYMSSEVLSAYILEIEEGFGQKHQWSQRLKNTRPYIKI